MLPRTKVEGPSRLTTIPSAEQEPTPPGRSEGRGLLPQQVAAPATNRSAIGTLKANRKRVLVGAAVAVLLAAGWFGFDYVTAGRFMVSTDDAYVRANTTTLGAKVPGYVSEFLVEDNSRVRAGDVIARIDDGDYRLAGNSGSHDRAFRPAD